MKRAIMLAAASAALVSACADDGPKANADAGDSRVVNIEMTDMTFNPKTVDAEPGETVTFVFHNQGSVKHEAVFGGLDEQQMHHDEMAALADQSHGSMTDDQKDHGQMDDGQMDDGQMEHGQMEHGQMEHGQHSSGANDGGDEMHAVTVAPGSTVEVTHVVDGSTIIGCHVPGHWEAGMKMEVSV